MATKLVVHLEVKPSNVHDPKQAESMIDWLPKHPQDIKSNGVLVDKCSCMLGDSAYHSKKIHKKLKSIGWRGCTVYRKPKGGKLTKWQKDYNHSLSKLRCRVEHTFGMIKNGCEDLKVLCKGIKRVAEEVACRFWAYNLRRLLIFGA